MQERKEGDNFVGKLNATILLQGNINLTLPSPSRRLILGPSLADPEAGAGAEGGESDITQQGAGGSKFHGEG